MNKTLTTKNLPSMFSERGIGFDRMFALFDESLGNTKLSAYPLYNLIEVSDDDYVIEIALAGFSIDDITITQNDGKLMIEGSKPKSDEGSVYLYHNISSRAFTREFLLAEYLNVEAAEMRNGMLRINLHRELPEEKKPRHISISKA